MDHFVFGVIELFRLDAMFVPHLKGRILQQPRASQIARQSEYRRKEGIESAISCRGALAGVHVRLAVPKLAVDAPKWTRPTFHHNRPLTGSWVLEILINRDDAFVPHLPAVFIVEKNRALQKIFVVTVDRPADVAARICPLTVLHIDPGPN